MSSVWYKCFPSDFNNGMSGLDADVRGVYVTLINKMYDQRGCTPLRPKTLSGECGVGTRRFNQIIEILSSDSFGEPKIYIKDGYVFNKRVFKQLNHKFISDLSLKHLVIIFPEWREFKDLGDVRALESRTQKKNNNKKGIGEVPIDGTVDRELFDYVCRRYGQQKWSSWFSACAVDGSTLYPPSLFVRSKIGTDFFDVITDLGLTLGEAQQEKLA